MPLKVSKLPFPFCLITMDDLLQKRQDKKTTFIGNKNKIYKQREETVFAGEIRDDFL